MATLTDPQKRFIVQQLAVFETPSAVADMVRADLGVEVERMQVNNYDASKPYSRKGMAKALVVLFDETRAAFRERVDDVAIANKAYRLRRLDVLARAAKSPVLEASLMEQAAKEVGDVYTNRRVHSGTVQIDWGSLSDDQLDQIAAGKDPADVIGPARQP